VDKHAVLFTASALSKGTLAIAMVVPGAKSHVVDESKKGVTPSVKQRPT